MKINVGTTGRRSRSSNSHGELDGNTAPTAQDAVLPLVEPGRKMLAGHSRGRPTCPAPACACCSLIYRQVAGSAAQVVLVGLSEEIQDTMSLTGFLDFFTTADTSTPGSPCWPKRRA